MSMLYIIGLILGVTGLMSLGKSSKTGNNGAMPTAKVGDEHSERNRALSTTDVEKGEISYNYIDNAPRIKMIK